jgi:hypothetical protein
MSRERGLHRRKGSPFRWLDVALPEGRRVCDGIRHREQRDAEEVLVPLKTEAYEYPPARGFDRVGNLSGSIDAWMRRVDSRLTAYELIDTSGVR